MGPLAAFRSGVPNYLTLFWVQDKGKSFSGANEFEPESRTILFGEEIILILDNVCEKCFELKSGFYSSVCRCKVGCKLNKYEGIRSSPDPKGVLFALVTNN